MGFVAYNKMFFLGKPVGRAYATTKEYSTAAAARADAKKHNKIWNKTKRKSGHTTHLVDVKEVGKMRKKSKPKSNNPFDMNFDFGF